LLVATVIRHLTTTHVIVRLDVAIDLIKRSTHLESLDLPLFGAHLPPPCRLRLRDRLNTRLKLVQLSPPRLHLLPHVIELFSEPRFSFFITLVEIQLDLAEGLEPRYQIVVEHAEVREGLGFGLAMLLLVKECIKQAEIGSRSLKRAYRCFIHSKDFIHVLVDGQE